MMRISLFWDCLYLEILEKYREKFLEDFKFFVIKLSDILNN